MCTPAFAPMIAKIGAFTAKYGTTIAAATSAGATVYSGYQQYQQGKYANKVAEYNARMAENEAQQIRNKGREAEVEHRQKVAKLLSTQRAQLGASGVSLSSGSPLDLQTDALAMGEADALRIRSNFESQASALEQGAGLTRATGRAKESAGMGAFGGSLLSAAGTGAGYVSDKWYNNKSAAKVQAVI